VDAIASARAQTCADIEILVGDDTPDGRLEPIVTSIDGPAGQLSPPRFR
jgi:hypothetical protein